MNEESKSEVCQNDKQAMTVTDNLMVIDRSALKPSTIFVLKELGMFALVVDKKEFEDIMQQSSKLASDNFDMIVLAKLWKILKPKFESIQVVII